MGGSTLDSHHGFVVEYGKDRDVDLGMFFFLYISFEIVLLMTSLDFTLSNGLYVHCIVVNFIIRNFDCFLQLVCNNSIAVIIINISNVLI